MQVDGTLMPISHGGIAAQGPEVTWVVREHKGETDWVFVDARTGAPRAIPREVAEVFGLS